MHQIELSDDQAAFVLHAEAFWDLIKKGKAKRANAESAICNEIVRRWIDAGKTNEFLSPLLEHKSAAARCAAATWLLKGGSNAKAISVLESLQSEPVGLIGSAAELALMLHRRNN